MKKSKQWDNPIVTGGSAFERVWARARHQDWPDRGTKRVAKLWFNEGRKEADRIRSARILKAAQSVVKSCSGETK